MTTITSSGAVLQSITRVGRNEPFNLQVSRGQITGHSVVNIFGYFTTPASANTFRTVWELGSTTAYAFPSSAVTMTITGTSGDTASILVSGLDANYNPISEIVVLNGGTGVTTSNKYFRINNMSVVVGSATNPSSTVTCINGGVTYAQINAGVGTTQMSVYTVPAGYTLYLDRFSAYSSSNGVVVGTGLQSNYLTYRALTASSSGVQRIVLQTPFTAFYSVERVYPFAYQAGTDIQWQVAPSTSNAQVAGINIEGVLILNDGTL